MTDEMKDLQNRLEQATSRDCPNEGSLDADVAALRAGWLALGELLETAQAQAESRLPRLPPPPAQQRRSRRLPVALAALAASLLVGAAVAWSLRTAAPVSSPVPGPSEIAVKETKPAALASKPTPTVTPNRKTIVSRKIEPWSDTLDQEIEMAGRAIRHAGQDQFASVGNAGRVEYQLESLRKDFEDNAL